MLLGPATSLVLVGDFKQLGPRVVPAAADMGLGRSLFERLLAAGVAEPHMLDIQYRMHPAIAALPSACFYDGRLNTQYDAQVGVRRVCLQTIHLEASRHGFKSWLSGCFQASPMLGCRCHVSRGRLASWNAQQVAAPEHATVEATITSGSTTTTRPAVLVPNQALSCKVHLYKACISKCIEYSMAAECITARNTLPFCCPASIQCLKLEAIVYIKIGEMR